MGTEFGMIKLPYIVDVFFLWLHGRPIYQLLGEVDLASRFLPRAIGNPGWSHISQASCIVSVNAIQGGQKS